MKKKRIKKAARARKPAKAAVGRKVAASQFKRYQTVLEVKRDTILKMVTHNEQTLSNDVGDEADVASQTFERELLFEMEDSERVILDDIEAALRKLEKGNFGVCESCRKAISAPRLKAMPWARYCISCQSRSERSA